MRIIHGLFPMFLFIFLATGYPYANPKVTQAALLDFTVNEGITILAVEELGKSPLLLFLRDGIKGKELIQSIEFSKDIKALDEFAYVNSFLRFKTFRIKGLVSPLIVAIAAQPTATDKWVEVKLIAERNGKIAVLNSETMIVTLQDGIYLGYLSNQYGYGMIKWNFQ